MDVTMRFAMIVENMKMNVLANTNVGIYDEDDKDSEDIAYQEVV